MRNTVKMAVNSCKEMYDEMKNFANIAGLQCATRIMISAVRATHFTEKLNTPNIYLLPKTMSFIVLFAIHFLIHSLKISMKPWQTPVDSGLNRSTNSTCATRYKLVDVRCIQIHRHVRVL